MKTPTLLAALCTFLLPIHGLVPAAHGADASGGGPPPLAGTWQATNVTNPDGTARNPNGTEVYSEFTQTSPSTLTGQGYVYRGGVRVNIKPERIYVLMVEPGQYLWVNPAKGTQGTLIWNDCRGCYDSTSSSGITSELHPVK